MDIKYFNAQLPLKGLIYTQVLVILQQEQAQKSEEFHYINFKYKIPWKCTLCALSYKTTFVSRNKVWFCSN